MRIVWRVLIGLLIFIWVGLALSLAIDVWRDQCVTSEFRCERPTEDKFFAGFQLLVAVAGSWLAWRRRWWWFAAVLAFWIFVPFFFFSLSEA